VHVAGGARNLQRVLGCQVGELKPSAIKSAGGQLLAVEHSSRDRGPDELDESIRARPATPKCNCRGGAKCVVPGREVERDVVVDVGDERSPVLRLSARQVIAKDDCCLAGIAAQQQRR
jgi:hypothetical protein